MRFPNMGGKQNIEGRFLGCVLSDLLFEIEVVLFMTCW